MALPDSPMDVLDVYRQVACPSRCRLDGGMTPAGHPAKRTDRAASRSETQTVVSLSDSADPTVLAARPTGSARSSGGAVKQHRLTLNDRGLVHRHRWLPSCSCGWVGVPRRRQRAAAGEYRDHIGAETHRLAPTYAPQPMTPADKLPDELRS